MMTPLGSVGNLGYDCDQHGGADSGVLGPIIQPELRRRPVMNPASDLKRLSTPSDGLTGQGLQANNVASTVASSVSLRRRRPYAIGIHDPVSTKLLHLDRLESAHHSRSGFHSLLICFIVSS